MHNSIGVVIVNYNTRDDLRACLDSLRFESVENIVVVDNASTDGSAEMVESDYPLATVLRLDVNVGFGAGANRGIEVCASDYVLVLNSDTIVQAGCLSALRNYADSHPSAGIIGPRLESRTGQLQRSCFRFPGTLPWFFDNRVCGRLLGWAPGLRRAYLTRWNHNQSRVVPWVVGAALFVRRRAYLDIGGFDENFFLYCEEIDLCRRAAAAGWQVHFTSDAVVRHVGGSSTTQYREEMAQNLLSSTIRFYSKHYSPTRTVLLLFLLRVVVIARSMRSTARAHFSADPDVRLAARKDQLAWNSVIFDAAGSARDRNARQMHA